MNIFLLWLQFLGQFDLNVDVGSQFEFYQCVYGFVIWVNDIEYVFVCVGFVLVMCVFVDVWGNENGVMFDFGWQWDWVMYLCVGLFCCFNDFVG